MRCICASMGFINENITHNKNTIIRTIQKYSCVADIIIFGEAFLQGFYGPTFDVEHDKQLAITQDSNIIDEICCVAKEYATAVSFGFIEKKTDFFTALKSQLMQTERLLISSVEFPPVGKNYLLITITVKEAGFIHFSFKGKKSPLDYVGIYGSMKTFLR